MDGQESFDLDASSFGALRAAHVLRPNPRVKETGSSTASALRPAQTDVSAPSPPHFAVLDLDRDVWRMWDSATGEIQGLRETQVLAAEFPHALTIVEACHLRPQSANSVAHPFEATQLEALATNLRAAGRCIRTVNNRRTPRIWDGSGVPWADRPKERDAEMWGKWLLGKSRRLESCKYWPEKCERRSSMREAIMEDANLARQYRQNPSSVYAQEFAQRVWRRLCRAFATNAIPHRADDFRYYVGSVFGLGRQPKRWRILDNPYICNAYCVAVDRATDEPRILSNRQIRHICGLSANGYPNVIRADLRHHLKRKRPDLSCTEIDRGLVKVVRALIAVGRIEE